MASQPPWKARVCFLFSMEEMTADQSGAVTRSHSCVEPRTPTQPASQSLAFFCFELGRRYPVWHEYVAEALWPVLTFLERRVALLLGTC